MTLSAPRSGTHQTARRQFLKLASASAGTALAGTAASPISAKVAAGRSDPKVGPLTGFIDRGTQAFLGIRYAKAKRFALPIREPFPVQPTLATKFGPIAPQRGRSDHVQSEDCQFLNIWTPDANSRAAKPVMVYFHGGAYTSGSVTDPLTQGPYLAAQGDVVVVTVNQRLNILGYGWLSPFGKQFADSGNLGQLDLICALQWVREHIAKFGGDPSRIMVFGQSGGGAKIATLMAMPAASGLFHSAATMSGQQVTASGPRNAWSRTQAFMAELGLSGDDPRPLLDAPIERLIEGLQAQDPILGGRIYFGPVLDHTHLPRHPFWPDAAPLSRHIPMILGNTLDETRAFIRPDGAALAGLNWNNFADRLAPQIRIDLDPRWVTAQYRERFPEKSPQDLFYAATTAGRSWPGQVIEADERAKLGDDNTWVYQLDRPSPIDPARGAAHTDDLPYLFGTLDAQGSFSGTGARARSIRDEMITAFAGMAGNGRPGLKHWTPYSIPDRATLVIAEERTAVIIDPRQWQRELWSIGRYIQPGS
ncbi:MAG: carboxylesterase family protein [Marinomonas sp.]